MERSQEVHEQHLEAAAVAAERLASAEQLGDVNASGNAASCVLAHLALAEAAKPVATPRPKRPSEKKAAEKKAAARK